MLEIDSRTRFSWTLLGRAPQSERDLLAIYAALLALATRQDATEIAHVIPGLPETHIIDAMALLEEDNVLALANALLSTFGFTTEQHINHITGAGEVDPIAWPKMNPHSRNTISNGLIFLFKLAKAVPCLARRAPGRPKM